MFLLSVVKAAPAKTDINKAAVTPSAGAAKKVGAPKRKANKKTTKKGSAAAAALAVKKGSHIHKVKFCFISVILLFLHANNNFACFVLCPRRST